MRDLTGGYRLAQERVEALRAEAARERFARSFVRAERPHRASVGNILGALLIRTGRALGGDHRSAQPAPGQARMPVVRTAPAAAVRPTTATTAAASASRMASAPRISTARRRTGRRDRLDRVARDLDRLARELTAAEPVEL